MDRPDKRQPLLAPRTGGLYDPKRQGAELNAALARNTALLLLAQADPANSFVDLLIWGGLGVVLLVGLGLLWTRSRRRFLDADRLTSGGGAFTLQELRDMRSRGDLSEEEFQSLRQQLIGGYQDKSVESKTA